MSQSPNLTATCAPERGIEPPDQGTALGDKGKITEGALTGQKRYRWEEDAFAPSGAESSYGIQYPRRCLGLYDCWPFRPSQNARGLIVWFQRQRQQIGVVSKDDTVRPLTMRMPEEADKDS